MSDALVEVGASPLVHVEGLVKRFATGEGEIEVLSGANFRLEVQKMLELFQQVLEMDRSQDEQDRPLSYLRRNPG